jgi:riboflavin biosynthesis pyrimidine reductase
MADERAISDQYPHGRRGSPDGAQRDRALLAAVSAPLLEPLLPPGPARLPGELLAGLRAEWEADLPPDRPLTYLNMIATADGRAALDGRTAALGAEADLEVLLELRVLADAVLIGPGTLRAEGYDRIVRAPARRARRRAAGLEEDPPAVLLTRTLDLPWDAGLFAAADQPVIVYTGSDAEPPAVAAPVEVVRLADPTPAAALADLRRRGVRVLLCEGGPTLNRALLAAGLVDELFLTLAPLLTGDAGEPGIVAGPRLPAPARLSLRWLLRHGDELFLRYGVGAASPPAAG